jgi:hypothetical protein
VVAVGTARVVVEMETAGALAVVVAMDTMVMLELVEQEQQTKDMLVVMDNII